MRDFVRLNFPLCQKKIKNQHIRDVVLSVINFLSDELFAGDYKEQPMYLQEIFELLMHTEFGDDINLRQKNTELFKNQPKSGRNLIAIFRKADSESLSRY